MAVNRFRNHLVVLQEDQPYREIVNGARNLPQVDETVFDVKHPSGGWVKVLAQLEDYLPLLKKYEYMHVLVLMDFDNAFEQRRERLVRIVADDAVRERVFMLGIDHKESEDLKRTLAVTDNEKIATILLGDCPDTATDEWNNANLACNKGELQRIVDRGVLQWVFRDPGNT